METGYKALITALLLALFSPLVVADDDVVEKFGEQIVSVEGRIETRTFYGPPGYGETLESDARETVPVLFLNAALADSVPALAPSRFGDEVTLQLTGNKTPGAASCLQVSGTLHPRLTGHHHTALLLEVTAITPCS